MGLILPALVGGLAVGMLYGLLAFANVVLFKATGSLNFAQAVMGALSAFVAWRLLAASVPLPVAVVAALCFGAALGWVTYYVAIRPKDRDRDSNIVIRSLALAMLFAAIIDRLWGLGQPFHFPSVLHEGGFHVGGARVTWASIETCLVAALMVGLFVAFFRFTRLGLLTRAMADARDVALLLGVRTRRLTALVWAITTLLGAAVAIIAAHSLFLSTAMLDHYLLYAFTAAIAFGLTNLAGAVLGGVVFGLLSNLIATYHGSDWSNIVVFTLLVVVLIVRPHGIFSAPEVRRV